ncbi:MAG: hypothetical protein M3Y55_11750 [Pseudomonadota bacterium]|nr:hypothetical protein [Pseudomonadota bacterium]
MSGGNLCVRDADRLKSRESPQESGQPFVGFVQPPQLCEHLADAQQAARVIGEARLDAQPSLQSVVPVSPRLGDKSMLDGRGGIIRIPGHALGQQPVRLVELSRLSGGNASVETRERVL